MNRFIGKPDCNTVSWPQSADEWWKLFEDNKEDIVRLIKNFHPQSCQQDDKEYIITAQFAEEISKLIREELKGDYTKLYGELDPVKVALILAKAKDPKLLEVLSAAYFGLPESNSVRELPGFFVLCDLCSEGYECLYDGRLSEKYSEENLEDYEKNREH